MINVDVSRYPLVFEEWIGPHSKADIEAYFEQYAELGRRAVSAGTYIVTVSQGSSTPSSEERRWISQGLQQIPDELEARHLAAFVVIRSALQRGVITALRWFSRTMETVHPVGSLEEAIRRGEALLRERGVAVPPPENVPRQNIG